MTEKKKRAPGGGRPTSFKPEYTEQAKKLAILGLDDKRMAQFFEVSEQTFNAWKHSQPLFLDALKNGKAFADANVAMSLYQKAIGYSHAEDDIRTVTLPNGMGSEIVITPTVKHYPPDTVACIFWLKNRQKELWRAQPENEVSPDLTKVLSGLIDKLPS